jgi:hypothetical protein
VIKSGKTWWWVGLGVVVAAFALALWREPKWIAIDFHTYMAAAIVGLQQGWSHIYDQALVAVEQKHLVPNQDAQPFLSPPTVAWLVAPLAAFPFWVAYGVWMGFNVVVFAAALAWSGVSTGTSRWIAVIAALSPWWVLHAVNLGQVVPLVAAGVVVAWRLLREKKEIAAGLALSLIFLKPNTAILLPFALLAAGRVRAFAAWLGAGLVLTVVAALTIGGDGMSAYVSQLLGPLPSGADALTLKGATGSTGVVATVLRVLIAGMVLITAFKLRRSPGLVVPVGVVGSLLISPYLHASDLCLLAAAAWILWEERPVTAWRVALAAGWVLASPYLFVTGLGPRLNYWPWLEFILLAALAVAAWRPLTRAADIGTRAHA